MKNTVRGSLGFLRQIPETNRCKHWLVRRQARIAQLCVGFQVSGNSNVTIERVPPPLLMRRRVSLPVLYFSPLYWTAAGTVGTMQLVLAMASFRICCVDMTVGIHIQTVMVTANVEAANDKMALCILFNVWAKSSGLSLGT